MLKIVKFDNTDVSNEVSDFEQKYDLQLPDSYKKFLLKYNGGNTPKSTFKINGVSSDIRAFYGFKNATKEYNFSYLVEMSYFEELLENHYLPIATDSFGNQIVITISEKNNGEIYFFDSEKSEYEYLTKTLEDFFDNVKSKKFVVRSIEERINGMKESDIDIEVDEELLGLWQSEIDKYLDGKQEKVLLD
ncbi:SMI1/KNR4 family protein [Carnobacterium gallinarum]|uniref:SMI1/KNR4 family protein n=1 Tax=Carnobacterium gallinarum TaxID=2749 RepID=UPI0005511E1B|nr:SMI1/KNR4 family protein [Carnobacterium gallinarum]